MCLGCVIVAEQSGVDYVQKLPLLSEHFLQCAQFLEHHVLSLLHCQYLQTYVASPKSRCVMESGHA
jgi:hypothetical protein